MLNWIDCIHGLQSRCLWGIGGAVAVACAAGPAYAQCENVSSQVSALASQQSLTVLEGMCLLDYNDPTTGLMAGPTLAAGADLQILTGEGEVTIGRYDVPSSTTVSTNFTTHGRVAIDGNLINYGNTTINGDFFSWVLSARSRFFNEGQFNNNGAITSFGEMAIDRFNNNGSIDSHGRLSISNTSFADPARNSSTGQIIVREELSLDGYLANDGQLWLQGARRYDIDAVNLGEGQPMIVMSDAGSITVFAMSELVIGAQAANLTQISGGSILNEGLLRVSPGSFLSLRSLANKGQAFNEGHLEAAFLETEDSFSNSGRIRMFTVSTRAEALVIEGQFSNSGLVSVYHLQGSGSFVQTAGETVVGASWLPTESSLGLIDIRGGRFCATGTVTSASAPLGAGPGSVLCPGSSPGRMVIAGDLAFEGSTLELEIAGPAAGQFDVLQVDGVAMFAGGIISLVFIDGFVPQAGDAWELLLLQGGSLGVDTLTVSVSGLPAEYVLDFALGAGGLVATTVAVPEPAMVLLWMMGLALLAGARRAQGNV